MTRSRATVDAEAAVYRSPSSGALPFSTRSTVIGRTEIDYPGFLPDKTGLDDG
jgi:hypothetical protein